MDSDSATGQRAHLRWAGADQVPDQVKAAVLGSGGPFEMVRESVLGSDVTSFVNRPRSLRAALDQQCIDAADAVALASPSQTWTYQQMGADIDAIAALLHDEYGVRPGDRVAIVAANSAEYDLIMWGVVTLGAVVASLNGWWTAPELHYGIALTSPRLVVGDPRRLARLQPDEVGPDTPVRVIDDLVAEAQARRGPRPAAAPADEDAPAVILFTSGTTGRPKGATLSHRNIINFGLVGQLSGALAAATAPPATPSVPARSPATILTSPMFHISGLVAVFISNVFYRTKLVFAPPGKWDPAVYLSLTQQYEVTIWSGVPTHFWRLLRHPDLAEYDLSSVQTVGGGGAVFPPELVRELHQRFPHVRLGNGYGMSETVGLGTLTGGDLFLEVPESVGVAQPTVEVEIRDETGAVVRENQIGEIYLSSPSVFLGYWSNPEATAECLDERRWYRSGDFGRINSGLLFLESRRRDLILRGGENIYPIEIENRLVEHPDIDDAAVIGVDHPELGQEVKAFVVVRLGAHLEPDDVRDWCQLALAAFKAPSHVEFREALPYTMSGKVLKSDLEREERAHHDRRVAGVES
jgi:acyl-CoA synthetase (AMP-forming)/AMP-acid ligase II